MSKKIVVILIIGLSLLVFPLFSQAETVQSGICGDNLTWELDETGTVTITGTGEMYDGNNASLFPVGSVKKVIISSGVTSIGDHAFRGCSQLLNITFSNTITSIGDYAFYNCSGLIRIIFPSNISSIGECAFENCTTLKSISIPASLHELSRRIFHGCSALESVTLTMGLESIGRGSFEKCIGLTEIAIPDSVIMIDAYAFNGCTGLTEIEIPGSVATIGESAFSSCSNLSNVIFNVGLKEIRNNAFSSCSKIKTFNIPEGTTTIGDGAFSSGGSNRTLIFPNSLVNIGSDLCRDSNSRPNTIKARCDSYAYQYCHSRIGTYSYQTGANNYWADAYYSFVSLGHNEKTTITKYPTCSETGLSTTICTICGDAIATDVIIPIVDHDPVSDQNGYDPTCTETGLTDSYSCLYCGMEMTPQEVIPELGHDWNETSYMWSDDNLTVIASHTCKRSSSHSESEMVSTSSQRTKEPTCTELGETTYYAIFENEWFLIRRKRVNNIDALGHIWGEPEYIWAENNSTLTARRICARDEEHIDCETVNVTIEVTTPPTCLDMGETTYTSGIFENEAFEAKTKTLVDIPALGHDWGEPAYMWAEGNDTLTAQRICSRDPEHIDSETVNVTSEETKAATCTDMGETTYTSNPFENEAFETQSKTLVDIPALGHDWDTASYTWSSDNNRLTAVHYCNRIHSHLEIETVSVTSTTTATCEEGGATTYTSNAFDNPWFEAQSKTVEGTPALGHDWEEPTYTWSNDYGMVIAVRTCSRNHTHSQEELVETTSEESKAATCLEMGETTYTTSAFENEAFELQSKTVANIPALGHDWNEAQYIWAEDYSTVTASRICNRDGMHVETETVETIEYKTKEPTCEETGMADYTSGSFENEAFTAQSCNDIILTALGHNWGEPICVWNDSNMQATATRICNHESSHVETEIANTKIVVTHSPTSNESGVANYMAQFENEAFGLMEKAVDIPALKDMNVLYLPTQTSIIDDEGFSRIACDAIIIPEGCTTIGEHAFAGCTGLLYVKIPSTVTSYPENAFEGCNINLIIDWQNE